MAWTLCVCRTSIGSSRTPLASWSCWRERATIWRLCGSTFPRCMSGHLAFFFLYVAHHQSFEILMTPKAQPAAVWTADLYRLRHLPNLHWSAAMIRPLMMTRPDEVYKWTCSFLQSDVFILISCHHFVFPPLTAFHQMIGMVRSCTKHFVKRCLRKKKVGVSMQFVLVWRGRSALIWSTFCFEQSDAFCWAPRPAQVVKKARSDPGDFLWFDSKSCHPSSHLGLQWIPQRCIYLLRPSKLCVVGCTLRRFFWSGGFVQSPGMKPKGIL